jgi:hypothetical protein
VSTTERLREVAKQFEKGDQIMTTRELLQMALDALEYQIENFPLEAPRLLPPIGEIRAHLSAPEPEPTPVAWCIYISGEPCDVFLDKDYAELECARRDNTYPDPTRKLVPLYTKDQL